MEQNGSKEMSILVVSNYRQRDDILTTDSISGVIESIREDVISELVERYMPANAVQDKWDVKKLQSTVEAEFAVEASIQAWLDADSMLNPEKVTDKLLTLMEERYAQKFSLVGDEIHRFEKHVMLQVLDGLWKEHLATMDHLRMGIHLRGYAGKNPKQEYKRESFELFQSMLESVKYDVVKFLSIVEIRTQDEIERAEEERLIAESRTELKMTHEQTAAISVEESEVPDEVKIEPFVRDAKKVGRNEPCPCGSGKKYKQCHGVLN